MLLLIIPCKNDFGYAERALSSIIEQSFQNWHAIIIFDQSPQEVMTRIKEKVAQNDQFSCIKNQGKGIVDALNAGVHWAQNNLSEIQYISRFDIDDQMPKDRLSNMVEYLKQNQNVDLVTGKVKYFGAQPISDGYLKYENWINTVCEKNKWYEELYRECTIASPNWIMRYDRFIATHGFQDLSYPEDYDLVFRWYENGITIAAMNQITLHWREHPQRTSRNHQHYQQKAFFTLKINRWLQLDYQKELPVLLLGENQKSKITAEILLENKIPFEWVVKNSERFENTPFDIPVKDLSSIGNHSNFQALVAYLPDNLKRQQELKKIMGSNPYFIL